MIEVPIDFVRPGDVLGKHHSFKKYEGGMSSTVNLMKGYVLTKKVLEKLREEFNIQYLCITDMSDDLKEINYDEGIDEIERQKIVDTFIENMNQIKTSRVLDLKAVGAVVTDILNGVHVAELDSESMKLLKPYLNDMAELVRTKKVHLHKKQSEVKAEWNERRLDDKKVYVAIE